MSYSRPEAILLDIDNTIYAYEPCHEAGLSRAFSAGKDRFPTRSAFEQAYHDARKEAKNRVSTQAASHCRLLYFKQMTENLFGRTDGGWAMRMHAAYWDGYFERMKLDKGAKELLDHWAAASMPMAWISDFTTERQFLKLAHLGVDDKVRYLVSSEEVGIEKPSPLGIQRALELVKVDSSNAWYIGDDPKRDAGAASAADVPFLLLDRNAGGWSAIREIWESVS